MPNVVISNFINDKWVDRIYMAFNKTPYLLKPDGTIENCKIKKVKSNKKSYFLTSFVSQYSLTSQFSLFELYLRALTRN